MRLAIADPPYPPNLLAVQQGAAPKRASRWYGDTSTRAGHPEAHVWDDPARHRQLIAELEQDFDGWALATTQDALTNVYAPLPVGTRTLAWVRPNAMPTGSRIGSRWEPVIVRVPATRRSFRTGAHVSDVLTCPYPGGFHGAKPPQWTRWILDALGYDPDTDTLTDMFPGSGAVTREAQQAVITYV